MDLEGIVLIEINQPEKDKMVRLHSHVEYKTRKKLTKQNKNKPIDTETDCWLPEAGSGRRVKCMVPKGS